jgi:microcystin-dependent protein
MSDPFIGEIRIFAGNFAPRGWAFCNGQLLSISQNTALFSLLGVTYGGDGRTTFALPDLQGRVPMHAGRGPGLTTRSLGQQGGVESVTLAASQMPQHTHALQATTDPATLNAPTTTRTLARSRGGFAYQSGGGTGATLSSQTLADAGGSQAHNNMQPYLALSFIIALQGIFPPH